MNEENKSGRSDRSASETGKPIRRNSGFWRVFLLVLVVLVLLLAICVKLFPSVFDLDRLSRTFRYMGLKDQSGYGQISFDSNSTDSFAGFGDGLLVGSENSVTLYGLDGVQKAFAQGAMSDPVLACGDDAALCFSPGGTYMAVLSADGTILLEQTVAGVYLDANVSSDGCICYLTSESGYKSVSTVLNEKQETVFRFSSRTRYLNACAVSEGGKQLAVASLGEENGAYRSELILLDTSVVVNDLEKDSSVIRTDLGNQIIYELVYLDRSHICAVGEDEILFLDTKGRLLNTYALTEHQLLDYSFNGEGHITAAAGQGTAGESGLIVTLDAEGKVLAQCEYRDRILGISASGKYTAVLTDRRIDLLDRKLQQYRSSLETGGARQVVLRTDGTAFLIGANSASLYIPD